MFALDISDQLLKYMTLATLLDIFARDDGYIMWLILGEFIVLPDDHMIQRSVIVQKWSTLEIDTVTP